MGVVAVAQIGSELGEVALNVEQTCEWITRAGGVGADLVIFPEASLSGYLFANAADTRAAAVRLDGAEADRLTEVCAQSDVHAVVGLIELDGDTLYNTAALFGPAGLVGRYRKVHLARVGADRYVAAGSDIRSAVFETPFGRIGLAICYDLRFPESARTLALAGADLIAQPVAAPEVAGPTGFDAIAHVRAIENRVYMAIANRPDEESGCEFRGRSMIISPAGETLVSSGRDVGLLVSDIDIVNARNKRIETPDYYLSLLADRRPELYGELTERRGPAETE